MKTLIFLLSCAVMNLTYSPDSTRMAYTIGNDLYVRDAATSVETRITSDGSEVIMNGYASWVYYEEIFGRASKYRAFWWSPDSKKLAFYRFDDSQVGEFAIYSPFGQYGRWTQTRYPKAGTPNPSVRIGIVDLEKASSGIVWADFEENNDDYFGKPFWSADSRDIYVQWEPRRQNELVLYRVSASDGRKTRIYGDMHTTWVDWIEGVLFTSKGLYMVRDISGWQQVYFLSFNGKCHKVTSGQNWDVQLLRCDEKTGEVWFMAKRDNRLHPTLYHSDRKGRITALTDPDYWTSDVRFTDGGKCFTARISTASVPWKTVRGISDKPYTEAMEVTGQMNGVNLSDSPHPAIVKINSDGYSLYGLVSYPRNFSQLGKYPVVMQLYGGPGTPYVRDRWGDRDAADEWCYRNGIIYMVVDPRSSGENGRAGMDEAYGRMTVVEIEDYIKWAEWLRQQPFVDPERIGVEGFSFGGTTTAMLVLRHSDFFRCGIAGGGVYDWNLYDTHYTERFMNLPKDNVAGYNTASVLECIRSEGVCAAYRPYSLKLTHGMGDDNVHMQNTLQLMDVLQECGAKFELMLYPDGMHGYRGAQGRHSLSSDHDFWRRHLLDKK